MKYLRQTELPMLIVHRISDKKVKIKWKVPNDLDMPVPVEIRYGEKDVKEVIPPEGLILKVGKDENLIVDPMKRILCDIAD